METEDPLDFALSAIIKVANIASSLGVKSRQPVCGRLGAELLLVANYIDTAGLDQENRLRLRISKLLRDVEAICNWPHQISTKGFPTLEAIDESLPGLKPYESARYKIEQSIKNLAAKSRTADEVIAHLQKFAKRSRVASKQGATDDTASTKRISQPERSKYANDLVHQAFREYMCCTCQIHGVNEVRQREHLVCLLLQPPSQNVAYDNMVQFDLLFSSTPLWSEESFRYWQDVEFLVPRNICKGKKKSIRFADNSEDTPNGMSLGLPATRRLSRVNRGEFCGLISAEADSRLFLSIQDEILQHCFEPARQFVEHAPGISLTEVLAHYDMTDRMKITLAYIIAYSIWQYYDSDWMKTRWNSDTIRFMRETDTPGDRGKLRTWKPYLSVQPDINDPECYEYNKIVGGVHDYPIVRALGIMLVEICIGRAFPRKENQSSSMAAKVNNEIFLAFQYVGDEKLWSDFDYPGYRTAVRHCLKPDTFNLAPFVEGATHQEWRESFRQRRNIIYEKVVFPLEELLHGTKWINDYTKIRPLDIPSKGLRSQKSTPTSKETSEDQPPAQKKNKRDKRAIEWLQRIRNFNRELAQVAPTVGLRPPSQRVRIAILDTGYDDNAPFFFSPEVQDRLKGWKDWVSGSNEPEDCHGHGTHVVSLIMKCAPRADIFVARVAKSQASIGESSENIAKAITWASEECKANIVSMSFGFGDEQPCIEKAILKALYEKDRSILFFAAGSNDGANDRELFPARQESVFSIRATNAHGDFEDFNPPKSEDEAAIFGTLGLNVPGAWANYDDELEKSGTSISTAIAAGMAGCLLDYVDSHPLEKPFYDVKSRAWTHRSMHAIFKILASKTLKAECFYLTVGKLIGTSEDARWAKVGGALSDL